MIPSTQKLQLVFEAPKAEVFKIEGETKNLLDEGSLQLAELSEAECYILTIGKFDYSLSKQIPILAKRLGKTETLYILPDVEGHLGIHLPEETQNLDLFESILRDICQLAYEDENIHHVEETPQEAADIIRQHSDPHLEKELDVREKDENVNYISQIITMAGDFAKDGITKVAVLAAGGISSAATFISEKFISKGPEYKMTGVTFKTLQYAKSLTDKIVSYKESRVSGAMTTSAKIVFKIHSMFENSSQGKKIAGTQVYKSMQDVGTAAIYTTTTIYDAMSDAMDTMSSSFNQATKDMVTKRYGNQLGEAAHNITGTWTNFGRFMKGVRQGTFKSIAKGVKEQKEREKEEALKDKARSKSKEKVSEDTKETTKESAKVAPETQKTAPENLTEKNKEQEYAEKF